jgi:hypothetical protein
MFSYPAGRLQTRAAKRAENRFNGVDGSSSGNRVYWELPLSFANAGQPRRLSPHDFCQQDRIT